MCHPQRPRPADLLRYRPGPALRTVGDAFLRRTRRPTHLGDAGNARGTLALRGNARQNARIARHAIFNTTSPTEAPMNHRPFRLSSFVFHLSAATALLLAGCE